MTDKRAGGRPGDDERGERAWIDRKSGAVHGSGAGAGGGNPGEDYDSDPMAGGGHLPTGASSPDAGHPLPASEEARHDLIPESAEQEKGRGDDASKRVSPSPEAVNPDGEPYRAG